jgi:hypothetical protein
MHALFSAETANQGVLVEMSIHPSIHLSYHSPLVVFSLPLHPHTTSNGINLPFPPLAANRGSAAVSAVLHLPGTAGARADASRCGAAEVQPVQIEAVMDPAVSLPVHVCGAHHPAYLGGTGARGGGEEGVEVPQDE